MKPVLVIDHTFRKLEELFAPEDYERLAAACEIVGGTNWKMPQDRLDENVERMRFLVAARPDMDRERLARARNLEAIIEVSGRFPETVDYDACFERGIQVLSCAPGFRESVAEMTLGMMIAGGRGIVDEHEAFRDGYEHWLADNPSTDFSLYRQDIGFVGFGSIAREVTRLLTPFAPKIMAFDPWLKPKDVAG
jgi:phosphoglycerate dehydrogenase-like enzyme